MYKQKTKFDCALACIACLVQKPIEELFDEEFRNVIEGKKGTYSDDFQKALSIAGFTLEKDYWYTYIPSDMPSALVRKLLYGRRAIIQVPSLNNQGARHVVFWDGVKIHDPSNLQVYRWIDQCHPAYVWIFNEVNLVPDQTE